MKRILLRLISLLTIFNLLFYSLYPAAAVLAQDEYFQVDEDSGDSYSTPDAPDYETPSSDYSTPDEGDYTTPSADYSDWDSYSYDIPEAETQEPFDAVYPEQGRGAQGGPEIPQESDLVGEPVSFIPEQETPPASEALEAEQQQQVVYYDDLLTSEEQDQLTNQAREEYQEWIEEQPVIDDQSQNQALSSYFQSAAEVADREDQEFARERGLPDADAQSIIHAVVSTLEKGQDVPDEFWQDYGSKLGDLADGAADLVTSQVREAQEKGEQEKARQETEALIAAREQEEQQARQDLENFQKGNAFERAETIRQAYGLPEGTNPEQVLSLYDKAMTVGGVEFRSGPQASTVGPYGVHLNTDLSSFIITEPQTSVSEYLSVPTPDLVGIVQGAIATGKDLYELYQSMPPERAVEVYFSLSPEARDKVNLAMLNGTKEIAGAAVQMVPFVGTNILSERVNGLNSNMAQIAEKLKDPNLTEEERETLKQEYFSSLNEVQDVKKDLALNAAFDLVGGVPGSALAQKAAGKGATAARGLFVETKTALQAVKQVGKEGLEGVWAGGQRLATEERGSWDFFGLLKREGQETTEQWADLKPRSSDETLPADKPRPADETLPADVKTQPHVEDLDETLLPDTTQPPTKPTAEILEGIAERTVSRADYAAGGTHPQFGTAFGGRHVTATVFGDGTTVTKLSYRYPDRMETELEILRRADGSAGLPKLKEVLRDRETGEVVGYRMEQIQGKDLRSAGETNLTLQERLQLMEDLAEAHIRTGVVHGDLANDTSILYNVKEGVFRFNPGNVIVETTRGSGGEVTNRLRLIDYGGDRRPITHQGSLASEVEATVRMMFMGETDFVSATGKTLAMGERILEAFRKEGNLAGALEKATGKPLNFINDELAQGRKDPHLFSMTTKRIMLNLAVADIAAIAGIVSSTDTPKRNEQKRLLPLNFIKEIHAQTKSEQVIDSQLLELLAKKKMAKMVLETEGMIDDDFIKSLMEIDLLEQEVIQTSDGFVFTTDRTGISASNISNGNFVVKLDPLPNLDVKVPSFIDVKAGTTIVPIGIREGSGKVEKVAGIRGGVGEAGVVYAQDKDQELPKVQVAAFYDENGNGNWDSNEKALPWAGIQVSLTKVNQKKVVSMLSGWNLITLTALPTKPLTASGLLGQIAKQDGYATTISKLEGGSWKSYVIRGDNSFSGDDFPIEPGKAYFVKNLKRALLTFEGQEFAAPVKVNLEDGWNAVGFPKTAGEYTVSTLIDELNTQDAGADAASRWESGLWDSFVKTGESYGENFPIEPNRGYIVRLKKGVQLTP